MNRETTKERETTKSELAVFWNEMAKHLPKSIERSALGDEKIFKAFQIVYPKIKQHITKTLYTKEQVLELIGEDAHEWKAFHNPSVSYGYNKAKQEIQDKLK